MRNSGGDTWRAGRVVLVVFAIAVSLMTAPPEASAAGAWGGVTPNVGAVGGSGQEQGMVSTVASTVLGVVENTFGAAIGDRPGKEPLASLGAATAARVASQRAKSALSTQAATSSYTIRFEANGGSGTMEDIVVEAGKSVSFLPCTFDDPDADHCFNGWNTAADGTGTAVTASPNARYTPTSDITLYAQWIVCSNCAYFDSNTGGLTFTYETTEHENGSKTSNDRYTWFTGWGDAVYNSASETPWYSIRGNIKTVSVAAKCKVRAASMAYWFSTCVYLTTVSNFNTRFCLGKGGPTSVCYMFGSCQNLTSISLTNMDMSGVVDVNHMFTSCSKLSAVDLSGTTFGQGATLYSMFWECRGLRTANLKNVNASGVANLSNMFTNCFALTTVTLTGLDVSGATDFGWMFSNCSALTKISLPKIVFAEGANLVGMFIDCTSLLTADLSECDLSKVSTAGSMFSGCSALETVDLRGPSLTAHSDNYSNYAYRGMFNGCSALKTIYASPNAKWTGVDSEIFTNCTNLVGGNGTVYSSADKELVRARVDGMEAYDGTVAPGYFTAAFTVSFNPNGGTGGSVASMRSAVDVTLKECQCITLPANNFTPPEGRVFIGWGTEPGSGGATYKNGDTFRPAADTTLYAKWSETDTCVVSFDSNGGYGFMPDIRATPGEVLTLSECAFTKRGVFINWGTTKSNTTGEAYQPGDQFTVPNASQVTLYARWTNYANYAVFNSSDNSLTFQYVATDYLNGATNGNYTYYKGPGRWLDKTYGSAAEVPWSGKMSTIVTVKFNNLTMPSSTAHWFHGAYNFTTLPGWTSLNTSKVTDMSYMFESCSQLGYGNVSNSQSIGFSNKDLSNVQSMAYMFANCNYVTSVNLSTALNGDLSSLESTECMFHHLSRLSTVNLSGVYAPNLKNMRGMFINSTALNNPNFTNARISGVQDMSYMFRSCTGLYTANLSGIDTSQTTTLQGLFDGCSNLTTPTLSGFDTSNATNMSYMFYGCSKLGLVDLSNFSCKEGASLDAQSMFYNCTQLTKIDLSGMPEDLYLNAYSMFYGCTSLTRVYVAPQAKWKGSGYTNVFYNCTLLVGGDGTKWINNSSTNFAYARVDNCKAHDESIAPGLFTGVCHVNFDANGGIGAMLPISCELDPISSEHGQITLPTNKFTAPEGRTFIGWGTTRDSGGITYNASDAFYPDGDTTLYARWSDEASCIVSYIRGNGAGFMPDVWVTAGGSHEVRACTYTMRGEFKNWNTKANGSGTTYAPGDTLEGLAGGTHVTLYAQWDYYSNYAVLDSDGLLKFTYTAERYGNGTVRNGLTYFKGAGRWLDVTYTSGASTPWGSLLGSVKSITFPYITKPVSTAYWFENASALTTINSNLYVRLIPGVSTSHMFYGCNGLTTPTFNKWDASTVKDASYMFASCRNMTSVYLGGVNLSNAENLSHMFSGCTALTSINLTNIDTASAKDMSYMFSSCVKLPSLPSIQHLDTGNAETMTNMFGSCENITTLNLLGFNTSNVTDMSSMFSGCKALTKLDVSTFDTSNITNMGSMFNKCQALTKLNLTSFEDIVADKNPSWALYNCSSLVTVYTAADAKWFPSSGGGHDLFQGVTKIVGGNGTVYSDYWRYHARVDGLPAYDGTTDSGYFTGAYSVRFDPNGGSGVISPQHFRIKPSTGMIDAKISTDGTSVSTSTTTATLPDCTFTPPEGSTFIGWKSSITGKVQQPGYVYNPTYDPDSKNLREVWSAIWRSSDQEVSVTYHAAALGDDSGDVATVADAVDGSYEVRTFASLVEADALFAAPTRYVFAGWYSLPGGLGDRYEEGQVLASLSEPLDLYAKWELLPVSMPLSGIGAGAPWWVVGAFVIALIVLGMALLVSRRRRQASAPPVESPSCCGSLVPMIPPIPPAE